MGIPCHNEDFVFLTLNSRGGGGGSVHRLRLSSVVLLISFYS